MIKGVEVHFVLEAGITCAIGGREVVEDDRRTVRINETGPDEQGPLLPERDQAVLLADEAGALRDQEMSPGHPCRRRSR